MKDELKLNLDCDVDGITRPQLEFWMKDLKNQIGSETRSMIKWGIVGYLAGGVSGFLCNIY